MEDEVEKLSDEAREKYDKLRQTLFKAQKIIQDRIEAMK